MIDLCPSVFTETDQHHFHQPAFDIAGKPGVRFDPAADYYVVGLIGVFVEMHRNALGGLAHDDGIHAGLDRTSHRLLGDAVALDDLTLSFGGAAAVAAHRRHQERRRADTF